MDTCWVLIWTYWDSSEPVAMTSDLRTQNDADGQCSRKLSFTQVTMPPNTRQASCQCTTPLWERGTEFCMLNNLPLSPSHPHKDRISNSSSSESKKRSSRSESEKSVRDNSAIVKTWPYSKSFAFLKYFSMFIENRHNNSIFIWSRHLYSGESSYHTTKIWAYREWD